MIEILDSPLEFKLQLFNKIKNSKSSVYLNCLYIGSQEFKEILDILDIQKEIHVGLDFYRGNRIPLLKDPRIQLHLFKSPNYQDFSQFMPRRWNETLGTFHVKGFLMDNDVIMTGANLSTDYFTNRQDRYIVFKQNEELAEFYRKLFSSIYNVSYSIDSLGNLNGPRDSYQGLVQACRGIESISNQENVVELLKKGNTFIIPTVQLGSLGIKQEEKLLNWLIQMLGEQGGKGYLSSAYLNIPSRLLKVINESRIKLDVLTSSPTANGFYGANNVSKYLPDAYSCLEQELIENSQNIQLFEYNRPGWTFHAKGFWGKFKFESKEWTVNTIGSSNFNSRSLNTDLESQAFLFTRDAKLSQEIEFNRLKLFSRAKQVKLAELQSRNVKPLVKLASKIVKTWL